MYLCLISLRFYKEVMGTKASQFLNKWDEQHLFVESERNETEIHTHSAKYY